MMVLRQQVETVDCMLMPMEMFFCVCYYVDLKSFTFCVFNRDTPLIIRHRPHRAEMPGYILTFVMGLSNFF